jgi:PAS domain S-box-containing protein
VAKGIIVKPFLSGLFKGKEGHRRERDRTSEESFSALLEHLPDAIVLLNPHDEKVSWPIVYCNSAFCRMNGYARQALIGQSIDIVHSMPEDPDGLQAHFDERAAYLERMRREGTLRTEVEHLDKSGKTVFIAVSTRLVKVNGQELVMGVDRDITELKQTEAARERLIAELDAFAHTAAHDIKSPLNLIVLLTAMLADDPDAVPGKPLEEHLQRINNLALKIGNIVDELLLLASVRSQADLHVGPLDMPPIVSAAKKRIAPLIRNARPRSSSPQPGRPR